MKTKSFSMRSSFFVLGLVLATTLVSPLAGMAGEVHGPKVGSPGKPASSTMVLKIAIPSTKFSATDASLYRAGYERSLIDKACAQLMAIKCSIQLVDEDPRKTPLMTLTGGPSGIDAFLWGGDSGMNDKAADAALFDAVDGMAEAGELAQLKKRFMKLDRAWPKPLLVGADAQNMVEAKVICAKIHANCTFVKDQDFKGLAKRFDAGEMQWVMHSQSWLFQSKDLEDRITTARKESAEKN